MASEKEMQLYEFICETLTEAGIIFIRDDRVLFANCRKNGDKFPVSCVFAVNETREYLQCLSLFAVGNEYSCVNELSVIANAYNARAPRGRIDIDIFSNMVHYRNVACYKGREITKSFVSDFIENALTELLKLDRLFSGYTKGEIDFETVLTSLGGEGAV